MSTRDDLAAHVDYFSELGVTGVSKDPSWTAREAQVRSFAGAQVLRHSEPILLLGIPESALTRFLQQYVGKFVGSKIEIGRNHADDGTTGLDAISGATVTVVAENQVILRSAAEKMDSSRKVVVLFPFVPVTPVTAIRSAGRL